MIGKFLKKIPSLKKSPPKEQKTETTPLQGGVITKTTPFNPRTRMNSENMTDEEKLHAGFNGSTYSINGRDVDF